MADELGRPEERPGHGVEPGAHLPSPTIWPVGFAAGVALVLIGLIVSWAVVAVGAALALAFGYLWVRAATAEVRSRPAPALPAAAQAVEEMDEACAEEPAYERKRFLEGATLGLGALIGGIVTVPALGFAIAPAFVGQGEEDVDLGPLKNFPEGQFIVTTFYSRREDADVGRRTAFIRNNGMLDDLPSFTIISNRCVHLGCPVQPSGPTQEETKVKTESGEVTLRGSQPSGFSCPCHGGAYDTEGNRTAGPPVRALDRYEYELKNGNLVLTTLYSVGKVQGTGAKAKIAAYSRHDPSQHVDGIEQYFYPYVP